MVGVMTAKALAFAHDKPFLAVNHLEGHALSVRLTEDVAFPYLLLLVSGGHCQLLTVRGAGDFTRLGTTIDDAVGECFDKTAKLLGLGFPGGPAVEQAAKGGDPQRFALPRPMWRKPGCDFSFSGLKTAVRLTVEKLPRGRPRRPIADLCASFQRTVGDVLVDRCANALALAPSPTLVVAGGVAANVYLRGRLEELAASHGARLVAPPVGLCTDNGAMIAWAGIERLRLGLADALDFAPRPRWPLDPAAAIGCRLRRMSDGFEIIPLFATPIVIVDVPDARGAQCRAARDHRAAPARRIPARSTPTWAAGSRAGTWTAGAARRPSSCWPSAATPPIA